MGMFNNYLKEGPGVEKDAPEKHRFFLFFELFGRKLGKLIQLNIIYAITLIPLAIGLLLTLEINPAITLYGAINMQDLIDYPLVVLSGNIIGLVVLVASLFVAGPATAGFTYVIRNFQREEHAWVLSDFFEHFKNNFKQGSFMAILDLAVCLVMYIALVFYGYMAKDWAPELVPASPYFMAAICVFAVIYLWMHYYIYVMMVTFKLSLKDILRNAFLFAFAKLPLNIFISIIVGAVLFASVYYMFYGAIAAFVISLSFVGYVITFSVYPTIDNYLITPAKQIAEHDDI